MFCQSNLKYSKSGLDKCIWAWIFWTKLWQKTTCRYSYMGWKKRFEAQMVTAIFSNRSQQHIACSCVCRIKRVCLTSVQWNLIGYFQFERMLRRSKNKFLVHNNQSFNWDVASKWLIASTDGEIIFLSDSFVSGRENLGWITHQCFNQMKSKYNR